MKIELSAKTIKAFVIGVENITEICLVTYDGLLSKIFVAPSKKTTAVCCRSLLNGCLQIVHKLE